MYYKVIAVETKEDLDKVTKMLEEESIPYQVDTACTLTIKENIDLILSEYRCYVDKDYNVIEALNDKQLKEITDKLLPYTPEMDAYLEVMDAWAEEQGWRIYN